MRRTASIIVVIVSVLLVAALSTAWVRSFKRIDEISRARDGIVYTAISARGEVHLARSDRTVAAWPLGIDTYTMPDGWTRAYLYWSGTVRFSLIGMYWVHSRGFGGAPPFTAPPSGNAARTTMTTLAIHPPYDSIIVPYWLLVFAAGSLSARVAFSFVRRVNRMRRGWCAACGYDLRESGDRCPECGRAVRTRERAGAIPSTGSHPSP